MAAKALAIVAGAGPGTGASIARAFAAKGYAVALLARTPTTLQNLETELTTKYGSGAARAFPTDISNSQAVSSTFASIKAIYPDSPWRVAVYNVNTRWVVKPFLELEESEYMGVIQSHVGGAFAFAKGVLREMEASAALEGEQGDKIKKGTLIFTGATAATRGSARFAALASASFALKAMSQSLAREFQPKGIHVAHAIIDGMIDTERVQGMVGGSGSAKTGERIDPGEIAKVNWIELGSQILYYYSG
ncbi:hypothetical protein FRC14_004011 [Serendipita sp. 396]|nr:hypothetical protein FRC14_004011 [Serendipita sp. 396]KAG8787847.1 hypothetical protein FRC15_007566 [Serendipita sp. 397]KAG8824958.1 hypothetical protein FRC19_000696 [Serendipita sp. 401]